MADGFNIAALNKIKHFQYERPDKSVHEMVIERYWEKKEKLVKGKRRTGERCVQTR